MTILNTLDEEDWIFYIIITLNLCLWKLSSTIMKLIYSCN